MNDSENERKRKKYTPHETNNPLKVLNERMKWMACSSSNIICYSRALEHRKSVHKSRRIRLTHRPLDMFVCFWACFCIAIIFKRILDIWHLSIKTERLFSCLFLYVAFFQWKNCVFFLLIVMLSVAIIQIETHIWNIWNPSQWQGDIQYRYHLTGCDLFWCIPMNHINPWFQIFQENWYVVTDKKITRSKKLPKHRRRKMTWTLRGWASEKRERKGKPEGKLWKMLHAQQS